MGKGCSDDGAGQWVILQTKECYDVKILGSFYQYGEDQDIDRQKPNALGKEYPAERADQRRYKYVANIGPNKIIMHIKCDINLY